MVHSILVIPLICIGDCRSTIQENQVTHRERCLGKLFIQKNVKPKQQ